MRTWVVDVVDFNRHAFSQPASVNPARVAGLSPYNSPCPQQFGCDDRFLLGRGANASIARR